MGEQAEASETAFWGDITDTEALQCYQTLVDILDDGIYQLDAEGYFVAVNDQFVELTGYEHEELLGEHISLLLNEDNSTTEQFLTNPADHSERLEFTVQTAEGDPVRCEVQVSLLEGDGTVQRTVGIVRDVTERKQVERQTDELETELNEVFGRVSDAFYAVDEEWRFTYINEQAEELVGYTEAELVGERLWDVFPEATDTVAWEDFHEAMDANEPRSHVHYYDPLDTWIEETAYPSETGLSVYFRDVSGRVERERELRETKTRLEVATSAGSVGTWTWNIQEDVVTADEYLVETYGMDAEEAAAGVPMKVFYEPIHEHDEEQTWDQLERAVEETGELEAEYRVRDANGEIRWILARGEVEYDENDDPVRMNGAISEITDRKQREQLLEEQKELLERIASGDPLEECLSALCTAVSNLNPNVRASILLADDEYEAFQQPIAPDLSPSWGEGLEDAPINELMIGTCGEAVFRGESITCEDVPTDNRWSTEWRDLCVANGVLAAHSEPIRSADGTSEGSFMLCFDEPRAPNEWEQRLADFGTHVASIALERDRSRQALQEREQYLNALIETTPACIKVVDADGTLLQMNPAGLDMMQADSEPDVVGECVYGLIAPEHRERFRKFNERICRGESGTLEFDIIGLEGKRRHMETHAAPMHNPDGTISQVALTRDITDRTEREAELERALDLLEKTERIADVGGWEIDVNTKDVFWTDHIFDLLEVTADEEPPLEEALDMYHEEDQQIVEEAIEKALNSGDPFDVETRIRTDSGEIRWLRLQGVPETVDDEVVSFRGAAQDVTERVERERELEARNDHLDSFASMLAHELRNPVTIGQIYSQQLPTDAAPDAVEYVTEAFDRIEDMIDIMLVVAQGREAVGDRTRVHLPTVAQEAWNQVDAPEATLEVSINGAIQADETYIRHMFRNLFENAVEHGGADVTVTVDKCPNGIYVADDGSGIPDEDRDAVFEEGYTTTADQGGTGLGLAFVRKLADVYDWTCGVTESAAGGARFEFTRIDQDAQQT